jgi:hypothetical protein
MMQTPYFINRDNFLVAAHAAGAAMTAIPSPIDGNLTTNIAALGPTEADTLVLVSSGLHGVELSAGSAVQCLWLPEARKLTELRQDVRFVFVHALNPYGAAHALRTDSDAAGQNNIDPARNFVDFAAAKTMADPDIAAAFAAADLSSPSLALMWGRLLYAAFVRQGQSAFKRHFVQGQFTDPLLPYYGGTRPCHARNIWENVMAIYAKTPSIRRIIHLDIHTGDGPFGMLQAYVNDKEGGAAHHLALRLFPPERVQLTGGYFADIQGDILDFWHKVGINPVTEICAMTLEYGTTQARIAGIDVLGAILNRTLLQQKYGDNHPKADDILAQMHEAFAPRNPAWEEAVVNQAAGVWGKLALLLGSAD